MGLRSWFKRRSSPKRASSASKPTGTISNESMQGSGTGSASSTVGGPDSDIWEPLPAYLPVDPRNHTHACVIASAIAAGDHPTSEFRVKRVLIANPEHRTVSIIATALAAGALPESSFTVKNIYKMKEEGSHAA